MAASASSRKLGRNLALVLALTGGATRAESTSQAELTCVLGSGELLGGAARQRLDDAPWHSLASIRRGDENRARVAVSRSDDGLVPGVTTSASLRLELAWPEEAAGAAGLRDLSSFIAVAKQLGHRTELALSAFPFDTDHLRLGYLHALDWGGTDRERGESVFSSPTGSVPGVRLALTTPETQLFVALKWARTTDALQGERRLWGLLTGGSVKLSTTLGVDGGFGYFQRPAFTPAGGRSSFVEGASLRVVWHRGQAQEPELSAEPFRPPSLTEDSTRLESERRSGFAVALEGVTLVERLRRFEQPSAQRLAPAPAAAVYGSARGRSLAAHFALTWRSLAFVLRNDERLARGETLPASAVERAELTAWFGASATLRAVPLVPSFELAMRLPAAIEGPSVLPGFPQTLVAGGPAGLEALPVGAGRLPVLSARLAARFRASASLSLSLFGDYERDPNRVAFAALASGVTRTFASPDSLLLSAAAQARF